MKALRIRLRKGDSLPEDMVTSIEAKLMDACHQFVGREARDPEDMTFLTADENIEIIVKNWRR